MNDELLPIGTRVVGIYARDGNNELLHKLGTIIDKDEETPEDSYAYCVEFDEPICDHGYCACLNGNIHAQDGHGWIVYKDDIMPASEPPLEIKLNFDAVL